MKKFFFKKLASFLFFLFIFIFIWTLVGLVMNAKRITGTLTYFAFKRNGWRFVAKDKEDSVLSVYIADSKMAHMKTGYQIENMITGSRITLCAEEYTDKIIVFFENVPHEQIYRFVHVFQPDVIFIMEGEKTFRVEYPQMIILYKLHMMLFMFAIPGKAHKRDGEMHTRWLTSDLVCVPTAFTRQGLSIGNLGSQGTAKSKAGKQIPDGHMAEQAILCTDSIKADRYLITLLKVWYVTGEKGKHMKKGLGIQCANACYAHIKYLVEISFRNTETNCLHNCLIGYIFFGHAKETFGEKLTILSKFIASNICQSPCIQIPIRAHVPILT